MARWTADEVLALAPDTAAAVAARGLAVPSTWSAAGSDDRGVWGLCLGTTREPYQVVVDVASRVSRCSCPSRKLPCKHALGLLLLWADGHVVEVSPPPFAATWLAARGDRRAREADRDPGPPAEVRARPSAASPSAAREKRQRQRAERVRTGLVELERWLADQVRGGLAAPHLSRYGTWDDVAARLVDAQAPALANRVRRIGTLVGAGAGWHERVLEELSLVHALAAGGSRLPALPAPLATSVRQAVGWATPKEDVLAGVPVTDRWHVAARSDTEEDRIVVRRTWLWGSATRRWAMVLSFVGLGQVPDDGLVVGTTVLADLHPYPGGLPLRCLVGATHEPAQLDEHGPVPQTLAEALEARGRALAAEPWLERWPACVAVGLARDRDAWHLSDTTGALPIARSVDVAGLVAASAGHRVPVTVELHAGAAVPLAVHLDGRTVEL
jgi:hypothetical protein